MVVWRVGKRAELWGIGKAVKMAFSTADWMAEWWGVDTAARSDDLLAEAMAGDSAERRVALRVDSSAASKVY